MAKNNSSSNRGAVIWIALLFGFILGVLVAVVVMNYLNPVKYSPTSQEAPLVRPVKSTVPTKQTETLAKPDDQASPQPVVEDKPIAQQMVATTPAPKIIKGDTTQETTSSNAQPVSEPEKPVPQTTAPKSEDAIGELIKERYQPTALQVGAVGTEASVQALKAKMLMLGFEAKSKQVKSQNRTFYRVYIGPFKTKKEYDAAISRLKAEKVGYTVFSY
ncbi:SPOR domain-containing protein [Basilea psittacipulmonis]|uniref:SPOR domain-containing protein n=1 Tax=Basilea psittacipulmonis DSM 24701 TaxID=1072685 RepID=A0A077DBH9_9BURK|nr:SPOR domain-containing protein [Basilea psittacipulmonis]AIL32029.1 hypothetical protein IX83_00635 [Basilea psittacipulmonis DSM 24701]